MVENKETNPLGVDYLIRNEQFVLELDGFTVKKGEKVGNSNRYAFYSAGSYQSKIVGSEVFVGIKLQQGYNDPRDRFIHELSIMSAISEDLPHLSEELPLFYALLLDRNGLEVGMLMEDFSRGGEYDFFEFAARANEIKTLFPDGAVDDDDILHAGFRFNGKRRLGDFWLWNQLAYADNSDAIVYKPLIERELNKHTLRLDYDLV